MRNILYWVVKIFIPNLVLALFVLGLLFYRENIEGTTYIMLISGMLIYFVLRLYFYYYRVGFFLWNNIRNLRQIINEFKKGKFVLNESDIIVSDKISQVLRELLTVGKQFDSIVTSQSDELKKFHEIYSHIICSINSHFVVIDRDENVIYANEGFCKKFSVEADRVIGKGLNSLFYFVNTRLKMGISQVMKEQGADTVVLKNVHLMSIHRKSIISDLKISYMTLNDEPQVVIIIDDITDRFSKDYHASILSHLSETMGEEAEAETTFYNILVGVTSGSGLGFNRAMLFMLNEDVLTGKMAVGPDSFDEAIEIWNSLSSTDTDYTVQYPIEIKRGNLLKKVQGYSISLSEDNIFTRVVKNKERVHVQDSWNDERLDEEIRSFMEVDEFVAMPMISSGKVIGLIIADNKYNMTGISSQSIDLLSIFTFQAAFLIENYLNLTEVKKEMKKLEERQDAIVESEKMAAVGRIASHIAHEIRNPLVTMGGYAKRILKHSSDGSPDLKKITKSADIILKESERLEKILSNVMDFTKPSKYIKEFNDINHIIRDTYRLLKNVLLEKSIKVRMDLDEGLPNVKSDFNQMKQVLLNLFQNAIDATPSGGGIHIITESDEASIIVRFIDSGSGIDADNPDVIFEPFFTTKITGVGLGLANVRKIIKDHRGKIWAFNREEGGAEFVIKIPLPVVEQKAVINEENI
ncbi:MAG TPA: ATP-binding protein [Spirochaetota bacterium]|nr:ATP-binding protein [Spirochaetota bacterium]HPJ34629.1 ATP-binding protein [Spirochaetota bacterium]